MDNQIETERRSSSPRCTPSSSSSASKDIQNEESASVRFCEMLMRHLPNGMLLRKIMEASQSELDAKSLPNLFSGAQTNTKDRFCGWCGVHLGMWEAFHGNIIETMGAFPICVCSVDCLHQAMNAVSPFTRPDPTFSRSEEEQELTDD